MAMADENKLVESGAYGNMICDNARYARSMVIFKKDPKDLVLFTNGKYVRVSDIDRLLSSAQVTWPNI